jgi:3-hydroxyacyl-CoA dehydrogenase/enoyl-CoA hydratase/3-hydroxybutyryl-CoA epimerase
LSEAREYFRYAVDPDGIATLSWDDPTKPVNVFNEESLAALAVAVRRVIADRQAKGVILASAKVDFVAGGDLEAISTRFTDATAVKAWFELLHALTREMEQGGKPWIAAINGSALGGGLEIALACHARIAADEAALRIGLPEVTLGLFPAGGGTQRLPRLVGVATGMHLILEGTRLPVAAAHRLGIVDAVVPQARLLEAAKDWLLAHPRSTQPWDCEGFHIPGGAVDGTANVALLAAELAAAEEREPAVGPAGAFALACIRDGLRGSIDDGLAVERRQIAELLSRPSTHAMIRTVFFSINRARRLHARPKSVPKTIARRIALLGHGATMDAMGRAAIAAGLEIVDPRQADIVLADVKTAGSIEARALTVSAGLDHVDIAGGQLGLHLPIPGRVERFVEVMCGNAVDDVRLAEVLDFVALLRLTPIVTRPAPRGFTVEVAGAYVEEGLLLCAEGAATASIERGGRLAGMAIGPLALAEMLGARSAGNAVDRDLDDRGGSLSDVEIADRLRIVQSVAALRCVGAGVVGDPADADVAASLGWGFPLADGGVVSSIAATGASAFRARAAALASRYGERFALGT